MRRPIGGYTIIEVMIFMAITGLLLAVTIVAIGGQQAHAEFNSGMNDINAKVQQVFSGVVNGFSGSNSSASQLASNYDCVLNPLDNHPLLKSGGSGNARGANPSCIFLGKALQVSTHSPDNDRITVYSMLGRRSFNAGGCSGCTETVDTLVDALPVAAIFPQPLPTPPSPPQIDLTEDYKLPNGVVITGIETDNSGGITGSRLFGVFNSFNSENTASVAANVENGSLSLRAVQYPLTEDLAPRDPSIVDCLRLNYGRCRTPSDPNLWQMGTMKICFESTRNSDTAVLTISSSNGLGAATKLTFEPCGF